MSDLFECGTVLFESDADEEVLKIECVITPEGELDILQESAGPLTEWCFEESPHRIETVVDAASTADLMDYYQLESRWQLLALLRLEYAGYDSCRLIRRRMKRLGISYRVVEAPVYR